MKQKITSLCGVLFVILFSLALLEVGSSAAFTLGLVPAESQHIIDVLIDDNARSSSTGSLIGGGSAADISPRAYYLYINAPLSATKAGIQVTADGYRNGGENITTPFKGLRILAIGGSTTYGWLLEDYHDAWPAQLEALLKKKFGFPVQVINAGLPAGTSAELLVAYALRDQFLRPDIVIIHNGGNDAHPLFFSDYRPDYSTYRTSVRGTLAARPGEKALLKHSAFARLIYAIWLKGQNLGTVQTQPTESPSPGEAFKNVGKSQPIGFERNMNSMIALMKSQGTQPVIFPFYLAEKDVFKNLPDGLRYAESTYEPLVLGIQKNRAVQTKIAAEQKIPLYEMPPQSIPLEDFFDHCHLKKHGETLKAEFLAEKLAPLIKETVQKKGLPTARPDTKVLIK
jgi:lysophospholipase L1-like esterase